MHSAWGLSRDAMAGALVFWLVVALVGCRPSSPSTSISPAEATTDQARALADNPTSMVALRARHPVEREGASCRSDADCEAPLRCISSACAFPPAMTGEVDASTPMVTFVTGSTERLYYLEAAMVPSEQARGLMYRHVMAEDFGMIFVFPDDAPRSFWMMNTFIPLDMIFVRSDGIVDSIVENAEPRTQTSRRSAGPARYVIELNAGEAARYGIAPGTRAILENLPTRSP